jgi:hypothetical protein
MVKTPISSTVLGEVAIDHGPEELLVPLFLRVENAIRQLGLRLSLVTFDTLLEINAANRDSWMPLFPVYQPGFWPDAVGDTFCLCARDAVGRAVATLAVRVYDWPASTFHDVACSIRLFYGDVERFRGRDEKCSVSAVSTRSVCGRVALAGAVWVHPDWRKHPRLMVLMPRFARALCVGSVEYRLLHAADDRGCVQGRSDPQNRHGGKLLVRRYARVPAWQSAVGFLVDEPHRRA